MIHLRVLPADVLPTTTTILVLLLPMQARRDYPHYWVTHGFHPRIRNRILLAIIIMVYLFKMKIDYWSVIKYGTGLLTTHEFQQPIGNSRIRVFQFLGSLSFVSFIRDSWVIFVRDSWLLPKPKFFLTLSLFSFLVTCDIYIGIWCTFSVGN